MADGDGTTDYSNTNGYTQVDPTGNTPTTNPGVTQNGVGGFLQGVGQTLTGSNNPLTNAMVLPAIGTAINQYNNAGKYIDMGNTAAARADPFGNNNNRQQYIDELSALYKDPSQIANTPGYKFALNQSLDATQGRLASMGYGGTGTMADSLAAQASGLAQQTWNTEANRLAMLGGAQFDPSNAAHMQMQGGQLAVDAQNGALNALFAPFGAGVNGQGININNSNGGQGSGASNLQTRLNQAVSSGLIKPGDAESLFNRIMNSQGNISDGDIQLLNGLGIQNPVDLGGTDTAPGSYDSSGFGGYGDATGDPTLNGINWGSDVNPYSYSDLVGPGDSGFGDGSDLGTLFGG